MDRFKESLDRHITGNYGEYQFEDENPIVLERGFKPVKKGTKCSYKNCPNEAVCYYFDSSKGLNLCENHGGKKVEKGEV